MTIPKADDAANSPTSDGVNTITFLTTGRIVPNVPISRASTIKAPETRHTTTQVQRVLGMRSMRAATAAGSVRLTGNPPSKIVSVQGSAAARPLHERRPYDLTDLVYAGAQKPRSGSLTSIRTGMREFKPGRFTRPRKLC